MGKIKKIALVVIAIATALTIAGMGWADRAERRAEEAREHRWLLRDNLSAAEHNYGEAYSNYSQCAMTDWGSPNQAREACYALKLSLDDAHSVVVQSRKEFASDRIE